MSDACRYCGKDGVVPVLDESMHERSIPGNKYRRFCLACRRWLPMCSATYFKEHPTPHVLPIDTDPSDRNVVPLESYEEVLAAMAPKNSIGNTGSEQSAAPGNQPETVPTSSKGSNAGKQSQEDTLETSILVLNETVRTLVDRGIIESDDAYRLLAQRLSELTDAT